ncbi:MAG TPA: hypothetical protein VFV01_47975 [Spirillospora sp.]|nr:hypothetical protein [Spirillospora sp.]
MNAKRIEQFVIAGRTCRAAVRKPAAGLRACGRPATAVRVIHRRYEIEQLYLCPEHTPQDATD